MLVNSGKRSLPVRGMLKLIFCVLLILREYLSKIFFVWFAKRSSLSHPPGWVSGRGRYRRPDFSVQQRDIGGITFIHSLRRHVIVWSVDLIFWVGIILVYILLLADTPVPLWLSWANRSINWCLIITTHLNLQSLGMLIVLFKSGIILIKEWLIMWNNISHVLVIKST